MHIVCAFKSKLAHTICTFKPKFAHTLWANKAYQVFFVYLKDKTPKEKEKSETRRAEVSAVFFLSNFFVLFFFANLCSLSDSFDLLVS